MSHYQYKGTPVSDVMEAHTRAKFEYFRRAESAIDAGPEYHPAPIRERGSAPECGTHSGYKTHIINKTTPCRECMDARAIYQREYRRNKRNQEQAA